MPIKDYNILALAKTKDEVQCFRPRNHEKNKSQKILSPAELASGKKTFWAQLDIKGTIRNISPALWNLQHLTSLFIDNNFLEKLPPEISRLVNLQVLDVSDNQLHSLPVEMGDLRALQHLYLNNNYIRILPFELGKLSNLQTLELEGNPLNKEIAQIYRKPDATPMILQYLLRRLAGTYV